MPDQKTTPASLGLTGVFATIANFSSVVVTTGLLVWFLTVSVPMEHERAAEQRDRDRVNMAAEFEKIRERDRERIAKFWERHNETQRLLQDLKDEIRVLKANHK